MSVYIKNLEEIIRNHDRLYDEKLVSFLLENINEKELSEYRFDLSKINEYSVKTNIDGFLSKKFEYDSSKKVEIWKNKINKHFPNLLTVEHYYLLNKKTDCISKSGFEALNNISNYIKEYNNGRLENLTLLEERLWLDQFLSVEKDFRFYIPDVQLDFIFNIINRNNDYLLDLSEKKKSNLFLTNKNLRDFLGRLTPDKKSLIVKEDQIEILIKTYETKLYRKKDFSLSKFLPMANSMLSFNLIKGENIFNPYTFFEKLFNYGTGLNKKTILMALTPNINLNSILVEQDQKVKYKAASNEILHQLTFYKKILKEQIIDKKDIEFFYIAIMLTQNKDLYKEARQIFEFPENSSVIESLKNKKWNASWCFKDFDIEIFKNKLEEELNTNDLVGKKIKI